MKIAVIGGGIAGLVAAYELVKGGYRPILIEPDRAGGMIRSRSHEGFTLELGPNVLVERPDMVSLLSELGLTPEIRYPTVKRYGQYVWWRGAARKVPAGLGELCRTPLFPLKVKAAIPWRLMRPGLLRPSAQDLSVLDFFSPLIGEDATRAVLDPVLKGIYGGDVDQLSARTIFPGLWSAAVEGVSIAGYMRRRPRGPKPSIMVLNGGIQRLVDALIERLNGRIEYVHSRVQRVSESSPREWTLSLADGGEVRVNACIATIAGGGLSSIVDGVDEALSRKISGVRYASLTVVHLAVPRDERLMRDAFGVLFPGGMRDDLLGVMFNSLIFPHVAPPDKHILTVMLGGAQARGKSVDQAGLQERLPTLVSDLLGISVPEWISLTEWKEAIPQLQVGHHALVASLDECEIAHPGLVFAGVDRGGIGVSDRVRIAREAVQRVYKSVA